MVNRSARPVWPSNPLDASLVANSASGNAASVLMALVGGANVHVVHASTNETPLQAAAAEGHASIVQMLLHANANTEMRDSQGKTALMKAAASHSSNSKNAVSVVQMLLRRGAMVNAVDRQGQTALHFACKELARTATTGQKKVLLPIIQELCQAGADCFSRTTQSSRSGTRQQDTTPLDVALAETAASLLAPDTAVVDFLLRHGIKEIFRRHGALSLHVLLRDTQILGSTGRSAETLRYRSPIGTLQFEQFFDVFRTLIALDATMPLSLDKHNALPIHVAIVRQFPVQIIFFLARQYPDSLIQLL